MNIRLIVCAFALICASCGEQVKISDPNSNNKGRTTPMVKKLSEQSSLYTASAQNWRDFLTCWAERMDQNLILPVVDSTPIPIKKLPNLQFPKSYMDFVEATGGKGLALPGDQKRFGDNRLIFHTADSVDLFRIRDKSTWKAWSDNPLDRKISDAEYYNYTNTQNEGLFRDTHLNQLVGVGDLGYGAMFVLNPDEKTSDGEWEAWFLSTKLPGALRFKSFAELMQMVFFADLNPEKQLLSYSSSDLAKSCAAKLGVDSSRK